MTTARAASPLLIGGEHIADTDDVIVSIDPATGQPNHEVCAADARHVDAAVAAKADYVISGDAHLLDLKSFRAIPILTARNFIDLLSV